MDQVGKAHPSFELLSAYSDREVTVAEAAGVEAHLDACAVCRRTVQGIGALNGALAAPPAVACPTALPLISAQLDGAASPHEASIAAVHLAGCEACRQQRADWRSLDSLLASLPAGVPSVAVDARIRDLAQPAPRRLPVRVPTFAFSGGPIGGVGVLARVAVVAAVLAMALLSGLPQGGRQAARQGTSPETFSGGTLVAAVQTVVLNPRTNTLYSLEPSQAVVYARNASTSAEIARISVGGRPTTLALSEERNAVFVLDPTAKTVTEIDGTTNTVSGTVALHLQGDPTSIQVNQQNGQVLIASRTSVSPSTVPTGSLTVLDPVSKTVETVRQVEAPPSLVVMNSRANRLFVVGPATVSVLDATTYQPVATLALSASAVAVSAKGGADLIVSQRAGKAHLSFFGGPGVEQDLGGAPVSASSLPDGSFAVLIESASGGRIQLVAADGGLRGALDVGTIAKQIVYDAESGAFVNSSGVVVAKLSGGALAIVPTPAPTPSPRPSPSASPSVSPSPSATPSATPTFLPGVAVAAQPVAPPVQGAVRAATGVFRLDLNGSAVLAAQRVGDRIWFVDQRGGVSAIDPASGLVGKVASVTAELDGALIAVARERLYIVDPQQAQLWTVNLANGKVATTIVPFGQGVAAVAATQDEHLWLAVKARSADGRAGLLEYDPRKATFALVAFPDGSEPTALAVDQASRLWFADQGRHVIGSYEPTTRRVDELPAPTTGRVTSIVVEDGGQPWFGTADGDVYPLVLDATPAVAHVADSIASLAAGAGRIWFVSGGVGPVIGHVGSSGRFGGPTGGSALVADRQGHVWVGGADFNAFFVVEDK